MKLHEIDHTKKQDKNIFLLNSWFWCRFPIKINKEASLAFCFWDKIMNELRQLLARTWKWKISPKRARAHQWVNNLQRKYLDEVYQMKFHEVDNYFLYDTRRFRREGVTIRFAYFMKSAPVNSPFWTPWLIPLTEKVTEENEIFHGKRCT